MSSAVALTLRADSAPRNSKVECVFFLPTFYFPLPPKQPFDLFFISFLPTCDLTLLYCSSLAVHLFQYSRKRKHLCVINIL